VLTRAARLRRPIGTYTITRDIAVPTRDGVRLLVDMYEPTGSVTGTMLVRSPYGWPLIAAAMSGGVFASRGYRVILARCRGTFGSGGNFDPLVHEVDDGADTVEWMRSQPWWDGRFVTYGASYVGFTQWALLVDPPPELVAVSIATSSHDFQASVYAGGAFSLETFLGWSYQVAHQEDGGPMRGILAMTAARRRLLQAMTELPLVDAGERLLAGGAPWYEKWASDRDPADPQWRAVKMGAALDRIDTPVLLQGGWQDIFIDETIDAYTQLAQRGADVVMTIGPWNHGQMAVNGLRTMVEETLDFFDAHLGARPSVRPAPVRAFVTGAKSGWQELQEWPPMTQPRSLYLAANGALAAVPAEAGTATFTYDPAKPTPVIGGPGLRPGRTKWDDSKLANRHDVVTFTGPALSAPVTVLGAPVVELQHASDNPHADVFARLSEVDDKGRSSYVTEGFLRLEHPPAKGSIHVRLHDVAHRFAKGHRIRLTIAGGAFPRWERNLGTAEDPARSSRVVPSHRTINLDGSRLVLPTEGAERV
jgi:putative CocE/NonD family hydrolase